MPEKNIITNNGHCPRHAFITAAQLLTAKEEHPDAMVAVHPECVKEVVELADFAGSTSEIIDYVANTDAKEFIIGTVDGVFAKIEQVAPGKKLYTIRPDQKCPNMQKVTLEKIIDVLENETNEVFVDEETAAKAMLPLKKMLEMG